MLKSIVKLEVQPNDKHISDIKNWLTVEWKEDNYGFLTDWDMIPEAYAEKRISVLSSNGKAIGFLVYHIYDELAQIDIFEIKPSERKKGIGRKFVLDTLDFLKSNGVLVVKLFCAPEISEGFWEKCGFQKFHLPNNNRINMYKTLIHHLKPTESLKTNDILRLWDCEPHQADRNEPKWEWNLEYESDNMTLISPIIFPVDINWQLELIKKEIKITHKVKYFPIEITYNDPFIIIRKVDD